MAAFLKLAYPKHLRVCIPGCKQYIRLTFKYLIVILILCLLGFFAPLFYKVILYQIIKYLCLFYIVTCILRLSNIVLPSRMLYILLSFCLTMTLWDGLSWRYYSNQELFSKERPHFFIASNLYNNEAIFFDYVQGLEEFAYQVGKENVFISIVEDRSTDRTPELLRDWSKKLTLMGVAHKIITGFNMPDSKLVDRIEKLAYLRNAALQPFFDKNTGFVDSNTINWNYTQNLQRKVPKLNTGISQDSRVIFINDIYYFKEDLVSLINTNNGNYDAACAIDYGEHMLYDTWVIRDRDGRLMNTNYPFFNHQDDIEAWDSRKPVKVYSCWNGVIIFHPQMILHHFSPQLIPNLVFPHSLPNFFHHENSQSMSDLPGVRFRAQASPDECYASECLLLWVDLHKTSPYPLNIYMNPNVNVAYTLFYYFKYKELTSWSLIRYIYKTFVPISKKDTQSHRDQSKYDCWFWDRKTLIKFDTKVNVEPLPFPTISNGTSTTSM